MLRRNHCYYERVQTPDLYYSDCYASVKVNGLHRPDKEIRWNTSGVNDLRDQFDFVLEGNAEVELVLHQYHLKDKTIRCKGVCFVRIPTYPIRSEEAKALREMIENGDYSNSFSGKAEWEIADPKEVSSAYAKLGCNDTEWILTIYGNRESSWVVRNFWKNVPKGLKYLKPDLDGYAVDVIVDESIIQEINEWTSRGSKRDSEPQFYDDDPELEPLLYEGYQRGNSVSPFAREIDEFASNMGKLAKKFDRDTRVSQNEASRKMIREALEDIIEIGDVILRLL